MGYPATELLQLECHRGMPWFMHGYLPPTLRPSLAQPPLAPMPVQVTKRFAPAGEAQVGRQGLRPVLPVKNGLLPWGYRTLVMAILNLTPDSFSDGGQVLSAPAGACALLWDVGFTV